MRSSRALLVALSLGVLGAASVALAAPVAAGGPTSVLLVDPATGRTAALYATDAEYQQLSDLVGTDEVGGGAGEQPAGTGDASAVAGAGGINVTWLIHDVQVWRVDRIYLEAAGGPWIASQSDLAGNGGIWDAEPTWHRPSSPKELVVLLDTLGIGSQVQPEAGSQDVVVTTAPAPPADRPRTPLATTGSPVAGPLWGAGGIGVGAALALGAARLRRRDEADPVPAADDVEVLSSHP